jgi:ActR/RegA family two-component response regulator
MKFIIGVRSAEEYNRLASLLEPIVNITIEEVSHTVGGTISAVERIRPDAVLLDLRLTDGSGLDVLKVMEQRHLKP